jgi:crotonobetainyl-CoA:carnitine CoA-transferase CaiB-like acyl-CoA transferase
MSEAPLRGIRVIDLSRLLPGPLATLFLADLGAEVIKVELPQQPDYVRHYPPFYTTDKGERFSANYLALNRSKKNVAIDYTHPEGRQLLIELIKTADVVVEQFRPGYLSQYGLDYESLAQIHPRLIYVSISGYGQNGPYASRAGHDLNYLAYSGILGLNTHQDKPLLPPVQIADIAGGSYMAVMGTLTALLARHRSQQGEHVDVSMTQGALPMLHLLMAEYWANGQLPTRETMPLAGGLINYEVYRCKDGKWIAFAALEPKFWMRFCEAIGKPELLGLGLDQNTSAEKKAHCRAQLAALFESKSREEWLRLDAEHELLISPIYSLDELEQDPHLQACQAFVEIPHPVLGSYKSIALPIGFRNHPLPPPAPAPDLGAHTQSVLQALGIDTAQLEALKVKKIIHYV